MAENKRASEQNKNLQELFKNEKLKVDNEPRDLRMGEVVQIHFAAFEKKVEEKTGK